MNADDRTMAGKAVVAKIFVEMATGLSKAVREFVEPGLEPGEHITAQLGDGTRVGKVRRNERSMVAVTTDADALMKWCQTHRPDEVILVPTIRPAFLEHLRKQAKEHGYPFDADNQIIPGIEAQEGSASYVVTPSAEGKALIQAKLSDLIAAGVLELPTAEQREAS
jgi:hypothetical protein